MKKYQTQHKIHYSRGVTLVELMIAIAISGIIALGISSVYTSSKRSFKLQEEYSRLQENGRFAINHITRFVRGAGYSGCASGLNKISNNLNNPDYNAWNFATGIEGYEYIGTEPNQAVTLSATPTAQATGTEASWETTTASVSLPTTADLLGYSYSPVQNTDILISRTADGAGVEVFADSTSGQVFIKDGNTGTCPDGTTSYSGICTGDILMISNCQEAVVLQTTNITAAGGKVNLVHSNANMAAYGGPGNADPILPMVLRIGDEVMRVSTKVFYIGMGTNGPALFMRQGNGAAVELVEGVETMQVLYGEDTDATPDNIPNRYVAANKVLDFANVVAVRVSLLLRSVKELPWRTAQAKTYLLGGSDAATAVTVTSPADKRIRKVMTTTIKVRNRAFSL